MRRGSEEAALVDRSHREEETLVVAFRRHTLLPLDDSLYTLQATIPHLTCSFVIAAEVRTEEELVAVENKKICLRRTARTGHAAYRRRRPPPPHRRRSLSNSHGTHR